MSDPIDLIAKPQNLKLVIDAPDRFDVREYRVKDGINQLFTVHLIVRCENPAVDFEEVIARVASFSVELDKVRYGDMPSPAWKGVVSDIQQLTSEPSGLSTYEIEIVPAFWLLTQRTNCRVFQQMTDLDVALAILKEWHLAVESQCTEVYKTRKYRVQYQESDFAFVSRMLESAGVSYVFEQRDGETVIVLRDTPENTGPRAKPLEHFNTPSPQQIYATGFKAVRRVRSGRVTFADHDPRLPNTPLLSHAVSSEHPLESRLESFNYVAGNFKYGNPGPKDTPTADDRGRTRTDPHEAKLIADRDAAAKIAASQRFSFKSNLVEVRAGAIVPLSNHPVAEKYQKGHLVTNVVVEGKYDTEISIQAETVDARLPYRPARRTPKPNISGIECATVVGPSGETVHTDEFGRVRVQFHWDRYGNMDEMSSCWVPVNQPWAGEGFGLINLPRIGQEVLVSFLGGDPEEPVIVGRIFTNLRRPPFVLPQAKNESGFRSKSIPDTGGFNLLRFVDTAGEELVQGRAEKDMTTRVNNDKSLSVGRDRSMSIERDDDETVAGNQRESVGKDKISRVFDNLLSIVGKDRLMKTVGNLISSAKNTAFNAEDVINLTVGNSLIYMDRDKIVIKAKTVLVNPDTSR
jgi:type VI secretion system secreted protein VgrG